MAITGGNALPGVSFVAVLVACSVLFSSVHGIQFYMDPGQKQCFTEDVVPGATVKGEVGILEATEGKNLAMEIDVWVSEQHIKYTVSNSAVAFEWRNEIPTFFIVKPRAPDSFGVTKTGAHKSRDVLFMKKNADHVTFTVTLPTEPPPNELGLYDMQICIQHESIVGKFDARAKRLVDLQVHISKKREIEEWKDQVHGTIESFNYAMEEGVDLCMEVLDEIMAITKATDRELEKSEKIQRQVMSINIITCIIIIAASAVGYSFTLTSIQKRKAF